ncbi:MAG: alpha-E domain-containing protein [Hyphomicrobiaceae bacterium]
MSLLSRYAEDLFWLARYIERASNLARIIETHMAYDRGRDEDVSWAWLVTLHADQERFAKSYGDASFANVIRFYVADMENPGSVRFSLRAARENARALRAVIPTEMWNHLNEFYNRILIVSDAELEPIRLWRTCAQIKDGCYAQIGVAESTLYRDEGWRFFHLGLMLERADQTSRLLDVKFAQLATGAQSSDRAGDATFWSLVLRSAAAYQAFIRLEHRAGDPSRVARFLLVNASHPRSVAYSVMQIRSMLDGLSSGYGLRQARFAQEKVDALFELLQVVGHETDLVGRLHAINDSLQRRLMDLTNELGQRFFGHPPPDTTSPNASQSQDPAPSQSQSQTST